MCKHFNTEAGARVRVGRIRVSGVDVIISVLRYWSRRQPYFKNYWQSRS